MSIIEIKVTLQDIEPAVTRTLQVPADIRLDRLHLTLQVAMGWTNSHLYFPILRVRATGFQPVCFS